MKYAFFDIKDSSEKKIIKKYLPKKEVSFYSQSIDEIDKEDLKDINVISVFIESLCTKENLEKIPKLKFIATRSTGFDHIDLEYCKKNNIKIANVPFYGENTVAEFTFGLLINISRQIDNSITRVKTGSFDFNGLMGWDLKGKTIGLLGFGHIGQKFAKMCLGFDMNVIAYDLYSNKLKNVADGLGVKLLDFNSVIKKSDIISLHMPLNSKTKHIINKKVFDMMKNSVVILNTARGGLINTKDLINALDNNKVSFAAIDVLECENNLKEEYNFFERKYSDLKALQSLAENHELIKRPNVYITPHNSFNTKDALKRIMNTTIENIIEFKDKKNITNIIK